MLPLFFFTAPGHSAPRDVGVPLRYFGHASFELTTPTGTHIVIDPYQNSWWSHWFDQSFPIVKADIVLVTHAHFDHNASGRVEGHLQILDKAGVKHGSDFTIRGITGRHARPEKYGRRNLIFVIEVGRVRLCHWGDNDAEVTEDLLRELGPIDILMVPVDESEHLLTLHEVTKVIERVSPRVVIPMHYFDPGLTSPCSTLQPIGHWLKRQNLVRRIPPAGVTVSPNVLPTTQEIWVFKRYEPSASFSEGIFANFPCFLRSLGSWLVFLGILLVSLITSAIRWWPHTHSGMLNSL